MLANLDQVNHSFTVFPPWISQNEKVASPVTQEKTPWGTPSGTDCPANHQQGGQPG